MYNEDMPRRADLPTSKQLLKSTAIAFVSAAVLLVTVVLPSEYAIDPFGVGKVLGLTEMGEIKQQLAQEALEDELKHQDQAVVIPPSQPTAPVKVVEQELPAITPAQVAKVEEEKTIRDEINISLSPGQGTELKLFMEESGLKAFYEWSANGSKLNFDLHGHGNGNSISYDKGRAIHSGEGELVSAFAGKHGWFFRNRTDEDVTLTLKTWGDYSELVKMK